MKKVTGIRKFLPPAYAYIPVALTLIVNFSVYIGCRMINLDRTHYVLSLPIDDYVPFFTPSVLIYVLAFVQWILGYYLAAMDSRSVCLRMTTGDMIAKVICGVIFLLIPTTMMRPEVTGSGFSAWLTRIVFASDLPDNLFPSIHCLESWVCFRTSLWLKAAPKWYKVGGFIFTILVCASTVLLKQHLVLDIIGGILLAEFGLQLACRIKPELRFGRKP